MSALWVGEIILDEDEEERGGKENRDETRENEP